MASGFLFDYQSLITGTLAVLAAGGTIWATRQAAKAQVAAAKEQTEAAKAQTTEMRRLEEARVLGETKALLAALTVTLEFVRADIIAARTMVPANLSGDSREVYDARQRMKNTAMPEFRPVFLRNCSEFAAPFFRLDNAIERFVGKWRMNMASASGFVFRNGIAAGFHDELHAIEEFTQQLHQAVARS